MAQDGCVNGIPSAQPTFQVLQTTSRDYLGYVVEGGSWVTEVTVYVYGMVSHFRSYQIYTGDDASIPHGKPRNDFTLAGNCVEAREASVCEWAAAAASTQSTLTRPRGLEYQTKRYICGVFR